jgi:2-oxoisovalerate ferredoxin oxidoreductase gamma subunit
MIEIRTHGRGGQGAVIASEILAEAFFREKKFVQAFPAFGVERRGAPVVSFTRISEGEIRERCEIYEPDHLIVLDPVLLDTVNITAGLKEGGWIIINTNRDLQSRGPLEKFRVATVDANTIARPPRRHFTASASFRSDARMTRWNPVERASVLRKGWRIHGRENHL